MDNNEVELLVIRTAGARREERGVAGKSGSPRGHHRWMLYAFFVLCVMVAAFLVEFFVTRIPVVFVVASAQSLPVAAAAAATATCRAAAAAAAATSPAANAIPALIDLSPIVLSGGRVSVVYRDGRLPSGESLGVRVVAVGANSTARLPLDGCGRVAHVVPSRAYPCVAAMVAARGAIGLCCAPTPMAALTNCTPHFADAPPGGCGLHDVFATTPRNVLLLVRRGGGDDGPFALLQTGDAGQTWAVRALPSQAALPAVGEARFVTAGDGRGCMVLLMHADGSGWSLSTSTDFVFWAPFRRASFFAPLADSPPVHRLPLLVANARSTFFAVAEDGRSGRVAVRVSRRTCRAADVRPDCEPGDAPPSETCVPEAATIASACRRVWQPVNQAALFEIGSARRAAGFPIVGATGRVAIDAAAGDDATVAIAIAMLNETVVGVLYERHHRNETRDINVAFFAVDHPGDAPRRVSGRTLYTTPTSRQPPHTDRTHGVIVARDTGATAAIVLATAHGGAATYTVSP